MPFLELRYLLTLLPRFEVARLLVDTYFDRVHWFMLIFYQDEFRQRWPKLYHNSTGRGTPHRLGFISTFLTVIAIGIQYCGSHRRQLLAQHGVDINLKDRILSAVRARLLDIMSLGSLEAVQTCVLLGTFYLYHGAPRLAWPVCGCGLRIAQALHLHRRLQSADRTQNETRKRCWWAIYGIETFSAVSYGYPHSIRDGDCDVEPLDPSAKLEVIQSPHSFDEPLACETTLLSYKYFMSKLSVITTAMLGELYRVGSYAPDGKHSQETLDMHTIIEKVAEFNSRLHQWEAEIPHELQWGHISQRVSYPSADEVDRDIGASGPRFENHIYQLQALALMLAFQNARILTHRPLLSYKMIDREGSAHSSPANPFHLSLETCRDAALSMSGILSSPLLELVSETYAASFVSIHTFTAGSAETMSGLRRLMGIQEKLKMHSIVAEQGLSILRRLTKIAMETELNMILELSGTAEPARSNTTANASSDLHRGSKNSSAAPESYATAFRPRLFSITPMRETETSEYVDPDGLSPSVGSLQYMNDPALSAALQDFDEALSFYAPQPQSQSETSPINPSLWPPATDGFPILEQTWIWGLDNTSLFGQDDSEL
ncbi:hypothetical protein BO71DRAFT_419453 [Aspergillus ellipticus CBS 707.79]|uniref:Xylanolytic transcriptional activator regulatory domain-containing protein n=1 Tax=Aspergillus ellipticus CBS 707.79 TaxID=1448320 RepID=A0A319DSL9_9EURO|nr:hypothetical protein BO71DRAFT_419453 [Aspergillus ellipticus CBS 707.79]